MSKPPTSVPAPTWRTHDWCVQCGMAMERTERGAHRVQYHRDWRHVVLWTGDMQPDSRDIRHYSTTQRAAFEALARG